MATHSPPQLLTVAEAAKVLRLTPATTYKLVRSGAVPATRVRGSIRIRAVELDRVLDVVRTPTTKDPR